MRPKKADQVESGPVNGARMEAHTRASLLQVWYLGQAGLPGTSQDTQTTPQPYAKANDTTTEDFKLSDSMRACQPKPPTS